MEDDDSLEGRLRAVFGDVVYSYTDEQAIADGVLVPFLFDGRDTGHRITAPAFSVLQEHFRPGYPRYDGDQFLRFFYAELIPLVGLARTTYSRGGILKTTYDFRVVDKAPEVLWYLPNERSGVTMLLPRDY